MTVTRKTTQNTTENARSLIRAIDDPNVRRVILFATQHTADVSFHQEGGSEANLPLLAAVVESVEGNSDLYDGPFLTAVRRPRYLEIRDVLDAGTGKRRVFFAPKPVPFTSHALPESAVRTLLSHGPFAELTDESRSTFFGLLSSLSESALAKL
ncbi:hypothetical protein P9281_34675 [Caballeronia sp. LP003]|uniref:hypothetical protein n=1 Tax=Caballeronia sp. LP003 TaxID=3038551 RepID=UPI0028623670|nr:hypothetical protein [Caballeronia sp. LP003]MDR5791694.1 hypothetical protein [Caballeronia sp. LP003]